MELTSGEKLGPYEILSVLGKGGMGAVYRANDPRLHREVAIKVSAERFSDRFEREARAVAALNHQNVCTLFDIGPNYLVMELIEGETLAEHLKQGAMPFEQAMAVAKQITSALEAAHERGITHRDLKPGNVIIRHDGTVKVLDFGLAKMTEPVSSAGSDPSQSPTMTMEAATKLGLILGTAGYMAPEQAKGKRVDKRADIWAFGVVFYEMLVGTRLFEGETMAETMAAVLKEEPKLDRAPEQVRRLLGRCLEKDPQKRLRDIGVVWELLDDERSGSSTPAQVANLPHKGWIAAAGVLAVVAAGLGFGLYRATRPVDRPLVRLDVDLGADVSLPSLNSRGSSNGSSVAISPDGMRLAYLSGTPPKLFTRRLDQSKATELPGEADTAPFFSPDSQWIGFTAGGKLKKMSVQGGAAVPLADVGVTSAWNWGEDGNIYTGIRGKGLVRIREGGGDPEIVAAPGQGEVSMNFPQLLPGRKTLLFSAATTNSSDATSIEVMALTDHRRKILVRGGTSPRYLATPNGASYLVYLNKETLFAIPFDPDKLETRGTALPILDDVAHGGIGAAQLSVSGGGALVYRRANGEDADLFTVAWLDAAGKTQPLLAKPGAYGRPSLSPDGQRVALEVMEASGTDIWVYGWQRETMTRMTFTGKASGAVWTPDGRYIVFIASGEGISATRADGAGKAQFLTQSRNIQHPWSFAPDGKRLAFQEIDSTGKWHLWTLPIESDIAGLTAGKPEAYLQTSAAEAHHPVFSPDGRWLAYASAESGTAQIFVRAFPDNGGKWQISNSGGGYPMWSRTGHELFFETPDNRLMVAAYSVKGDSLVADKPRVWSEKPIGGVKGVKNFDLAGDGKRIVALMPATEAKGTEAAEHHVVFLENFLDELQRKVPAVR